MKPTDDTSRQPWLTAIIGLTLLLSMSPAIGQNNQMLGANYAWFRVEHCDRDRYSVLSSYGENKQEIRAQLREMYSNGLRMLRVPLFHAHVEAAGILRSSANGLTKEGLASLTGLLADIQSAGFDQIEFGLFPTATNIPWQWPVWNETLYQENLTVIRQVRSLLVQSNLKYVIDLMNEGIPTPDQLIMFHYDRRLWDDYVRDFGVEDTVGFSINPEPLRLSMVGRVYGSVRPKLLDLHFYHDFATLMPQAKRSLDQQGFGHLPWIIGETYYGSQEDVDEIRRVATSIDQIILAILQWPLRHQHSCESVDTVPLKIPHPGHK